MKKINCILLLIIFHISISNAQDVYTSFISDLNNLSFEDKSGNDVNIYLPSSLNNDQCLRRIIGTPDPILGMFKTLYQPDRRIETYEKAIREILITSNSFDYLINKFQNDIKSINTTNDVREIFDWSLDLIEKGAKGINKKYIKAGTLSTDAKNKFATLGRELNKASKSPNFAILSMALANIKATLTLGEITSGALLLNALANDEAFKRLRAIKEILTYEINSGTLKDGEIILNALNRVEINLNAASSEIGSFAVSVNDNKGQILESSITLGTALAEISLKLNPLIFSYIWALHLEYTILKNISNQWESSQEACLLATITYHIYSYQNNVGKESDIELLAAFGQYSFYQKMIETLSTGEAKFNDFLTLGHLNKNWIDYYSQRKNQVDDYINSLLNISDVITLGFILDSSGSMSQNDPQGMRKSAVEMIIDELNGNENVFLIDFDDHSSWLNSNNYENYSKELLKDDIRGVNSDGGTEIGGGLVTMQNAIETTDKSNSKGGIILLTDGKNNNAFNYSLLDWYNQNNFPISTVSFVGDVDNRLLSDIASITKGNYFRASNAYDVVMYFREFINSISGNSSLVLSRNLIQQGESQTCSFYVDGGMGFIYAGTNWSGSKIKLKLISPKNKIFTENDNNGEWSIGSNFVSVKTMSPEPGKWKAEFYGENIPTGGEEYVFQVTGDSPNKIGIEEKLLIGNQMQFSLQNSGKGNISNIKPKIEVITPKDRKEDISNSFSNNGFTYRPRDGEGNYNFEINLTGNDNNGSTIQRYFARTVLVGEGTPSNIAPIKFMEGNYLYTDLGKDIGNFSGLECTIYSQNGNSPIANGYVTFVNETECTIEIQSFLSDQNVSVGDIVELNVAQWQQDF